MIMVMLLGLPLIIAGKNNKPTAVILITGCSTGIGRATALKFASRTASDSPSVSQSFKVWATMRSTDRFQYYDTESLSVVSNTYC